MIVLRNSVTIYKHLLSENRVVLLHIINLCKRETRHRMDLNTLYASIAGTTTFHDPHFDLGMLKAAVTVLR